MSQRHWPQHRAKSLAHYRQRREQAQAALQDAASRPEGDDKAMAAPAALQAIASVEERVAALEEVGASD
jgi:hypothetical protein